MRQKCWLCRKIDIQVEGEGTESFCEKLMGCFWSLHKQKPATVVQCCLFTVASPHSLLVHLVSRDIKENLVEQPLTTMRASFSADDLVDIQMNAPPTVFRSVYFQLSINFIVFFFKHR